MWLVLASLSAHAGLTERSYERAVELVDGLYLRPKEVDADAMLREAAEALSDKVHWLIVDGQGNAVNLRHGDGTLIGTVSVANVQTLPAALLSLETLVTEAGYDVGDVDVRLALLKGMTRALDRYSRVLSGDGLDRFDVRLKGTLVGVGLNIAIRNDKLMVTRVTEGGPGDLGGLKPGDQIVRIDGRSVVNMPTREATRRIRGEEGTQVVFTVLRDVNTLELPLTRAQVVVPNVEWRVLEGDVGYIRITHVSQRTVENLLGALASLEKDGALEHGLILDVRGNTGGSMKESARAVDQFVDAGMLLRTAGPDGGRVRNLQARMDADEGGAVPDIPVAVLVNERTASGAEILAGSLLELGRGALVGTRTYGKGTVQKIYPLDEDTRLKLTVAQYLLENDRVIADRGIVPDVVVGEVRLNSYGVRFDGWDTDRLRTDHADIVPSVEEWESWRGEERAARDLPLEIGRQAVLQVDSALREPLVEALRERAAALREIEEAHLSEAFAAHGIDWSPPEVTPPKSPPVHVRLRARPDPNRPDVIAVTADVENRGEIPLHQVAVELSSEFSAWDGLVLPVGRVDPEATVSGEVFLPLETGVNSREDMVVATLRAAGVPAKQVAETPLRAASRPIPGITGTVRLLRDAGGERAVVELRNQGSTRLDGTEVHFGYPGDIDVELIDRAARAPSIGPRARHLFELQVEVGKGAPELIPLELVIEHPSLGELATWPVSLPLDGSAVQLRPPNISAEGRPYRAPVGPLDFPLVVTDDAQVHHVVVYQNGRKVAWAGGAPKRVELTAHVDLAAGSNRLLVVTEDNQGLRTRRQFVVRGIPTDAAVDAP